ncbi:hypothetical protein, partial [Pseudomonas sp. Xaverov 259]|uniref:hypothetical protein n=1 Tax=Pseudomonas sp. Xaverov 259 TaxID=2666086 RepID=UPI001C5C8DE0
ANAPAGDYELTYQVCEKLNTSNCAEAVVKVTVAAPSIDAVAESLGSVNGSIGGKTTISVILNDKLNGTQAVIGNNPGEVTLKKVTLPAGFVLEADGKVTVPANTPIGTYDIEYSICEVTNPSNCDTAKSTVTVTGSVFDLKDDTVTPVTGSTQNQTLVNVLDNDKKDNASINTSEVNITTTAADPKGYLILKSDGTAELKANAPAGDYELTYQVCEKLNTSNCA